MPKLKYYDTAYIYVQHPNAVHGRHGKDMIVLHETISSDIPGLADIKGVENYLANKEFGIHGMTDKEGNIAWAHGFGNAVFWHCGGVNERSIGIEQVSFPPSNVQEAKAYWAGRSKQIRATAKLVAAIANTWKIPLRYSGGDAPGVTSHWSVSKIYPASQGHTDCYPIHLGGYYPAIKVIQMAKIYKAAGYYL